MEMKWINRAFWPRNLAYLFKKHLIYKQYNFYLLLIFNNEAPPAQSVFLTIESVEP